jgi:hypothetical protein
MCTPRVSLLLLLCLHPYWTVIPSESGGRLGAREPMPYRDHDSTSPAKQNEKGEEWKEGPTRSLGKPPRKGVLEILKHEEP